MLPLRVLAVCALVFCAELGQAMLTPLLPQIGRAFALGAAETGIVLSVATLATLVAAVPAGLLAERIGALRVSIMAGTVIAASAAVQALATDFPTFLCGRALFGVGFAAIWTAGVAVVAGPGAPRSAVAATMAAGGLAHVVGPPLSGVLSDAVARSSPFWLLAAGAAAVALLAAGAPAGAPEPAPAPGLRAVARAAGHDPALRSATVLIALIGVLTALVPLVVPLLLDREGFSSGAIGAVFGLGAAVWVGASALAVRAGARAVTIGVAAAGVALLAAASLMPIVTLAAPLSTISYDLGAQGARNAGVAIGTAMGMLNFVWAAGATVAPLVGGAVLAGAGARWVFVLLAVACAAAALSLRPGRHRYAGMSGERGGILDAGPSPWP